MAEHLKTYWSKSRVLALLALAIAITIFTRGPHWITVVNIILFILVAVGKD